MHSRCLVGGILFRRALPARPIAVATSYNTKDASVIASRRGVGLFEVELPTHHRQIAQPEKRAPFCCKNDNSWTLAEIDGA